MTKQFTNPPMHPQHSLKQEITQSARAGRTALAAALALLTIVGAPMASSAEDEKLRKLDGEWVFVEDRTDGRAVEDGRPSH